MILSLRRRRRLARRHLTPGSYLTDGRNLFRVISQFVDGRSVLVWIEDCLTLDGCARTAHELEAMGVQAVRNGPPHAPRPVSSAPTLARGPAALH